MTKVFNIVILLALAFVSVKGHLTWNDEFQPVQGLYVKPSGDGTTGDLYVAATEDNGVSTQWLTDQPVNFLPAGSQPQSTAFPLFSALSSNALPYKESATPQKRSAIAGTAAKYAYGLPSLISEPYAYTGVQSKPESLTVMETKTETVPSPVAAAIPQYSPYHYLYPHMINAAYASAMKVLNDAGLSSEHASNSNAISTYPTTYWPAASYYPMQYVIMDPTAWAKQQSTAISPSTTTATATSVESENENDKS